MEALLVLEAVQHSGRPRGAQLRTSHQWNQHAGIATDSSSSTGSVCSRSAERARKVAHTRAHEEVSWWCSRRASNHGVCTPVMRRLRGQPGWQLKQAVIIQVGKHTFGSSSSQSLVLQWRARPNPSLKLSANGRPPGPGRRYAVHFRQPGPGVLPSSPA